MTTATTGTTEGVAPAATPTTGPGAWRRHRGTLAIAVAALAAIAVAALAADRPATSEPLDPDNPGAQGARAVAQVLDHQGVDVRVVRGAAQLEASDLDASTTVLVTSTYLLGTSTAQRLLDHLGEADLVVAEPDPGVVEALGLDASPWSVAPDGDRVPGCDDQRYSGLAVRVDHGTEYDTPAGCFGGQHGNLIATPRDGVVLLGAAEVLTNDQVLRGDNAAVALRLLGQRDRLVWYVPSVDDLVGGDGVSLRTLVPPWIFPGLWIGGAAALALLLWRVRRLGALATEPLPVTVKAIETAHSRGRLYRKSGDRAHAVRALRRAARTALADRLHLPSAIAGDDALLRDVARQSGRPVEHVRLLLADDSPTPDNDADLITLAHELSALQREVRRP